MAAETGGGTPVVARPVTTTGYDTFGEVAESKDPDGNVTTDGYDADGRQVSQTLPAYTPPGASTPVTGTSTTTYNALGQLTASQPTRTATPRTTPTTSSATAPARPTRTAASPRPPTTPTASSCRRPARPAPRPGDLRLPGPADHRHRRRAVPVVGLVHDHHVVRGHDRGPERGLEVLGHHPGRGGHQLRVRRGRGADPGHRRRRQHHPVRLRRPRPADRHRQPRRHLHHRHLRPGGNQVSESSLGRHRARRWPPRARPTTATAHQLSATDALGDTTTFTYDAAGRLTRRSSRSRRSAASPPRSATTRPATRPATPTATAATGSPPTTPGTCRRPRSSRPPATYTTAADSTTTIAYDADGQPVTETAARRGHASPTPTTPWAT